MPRMRTSSSLELLLPLDRDAPEPLHRQLEHGLRDADPERPPRARVGAAVDPIARGSARHVARHRRRGLRAARRRGISREPPGWRHPRGHGGAVASPHVPPVAGRAVRPRLPPRPTRRRPVPAGGLVALRPARAAEAPNDRLSYVEGRGVLELRSALAAYLDRVRGTAPTRPTSSCPPGSPRRSASWPQVLADRGARRSRPRTRASPRPATVIRAAGLDVLPHARRRRRAAGRPARRASGSTPSSSRRRTSTRRAPCSRRRGGRRSSPGRPGPAGSSSRTTTTRSTATTASRSARSRAWRRTASSTSDRRARPSRPGSGSAG